MLRMQWIVVAALCAACNGSDTTTKDGDPTDTPTDTSTDDPGTDTGTDLPGLDARPANASCVAVDRPLLGAQAQLTRVYPGLQLSDAIVMLMSPTDAGRWYVAEQDGRIYRFDDDPGVTTKDVVLDIRGQVDTPFLSNEMGLLSMAFHPDFQLNGYLYVYYSVTPGADRTRVSRFTSSDGGATFEPATETVILEIDQPFSNHNGGTIVFGPDGYLYLSTGDGGSGDDPGNRAQDLTNPLGKIHRVDVDGGYPYAIPHDNPFAYGGGGLDTLYAWGLRNPFRMSFDPQTGELWVGDVGQNAWEEISRVELGGNYGWKIMEGLVCRPGGPQSCDTSDLVAPEIVYATGFGGSVIAGVVYNGTAIPALRGALLYNDFYDASVEGVFSDPTTGDSVSATVVPSAAQNLVHYTTGADDEVYVLQHGNNGRIYKLEPLPGQQPDTFPQQLSQTGCMDASDPTQPGQGLIPYEIAHPFWSDGADKQRWMALPDGETITIGADGDWTLPVGTVLIKQFAREGQLLETRLMMLHDDGWGGYSYVWDEDTADASFAPGGLSIPQATGDWAIPDTGGCAQCHTDGAGGSLGLETRQLAIEADYPSTGRRAHQLATLDAIGVFDPPLGVEPTSVAPLPGLDDDTASIEDRARAYLHVNCAQCHRPEVSSRASLDLRLDTPLADTNLCEAPQTGDLGITGARVITPGDPGRSILSVRVHRRDAYAMPPLGSNLVDTVGAGVLDDWIASMGSCP